MNIKKIILCLIGNHGYLVSWLQFLRMSDETRLSLSYFIIRPVISLYCILYVVPWLQWVTFIYFVISILDFIIEIRIICLRIFLLNTINISMFSFIYMNYLSLITSSKQPSSFCFFFFFFYFYFSLLSSQEVIYILLLDGLELTQLTTNTVVIFCVTEKL